MAHNTQTTDNFLSGDTIFLEQLGLWEQVRAAIAGDYEVVKLVSCLPGPQYKKYPIFSGMSEQQLNQANACNQANALRIQSYWSRGDWFGATGATHISNGGMIYSNEPDFTLAPKLSSLEDNTDGAGSGLREVVQEIVDEVISIGRHGVLVDMPGQKMDEEGNPIRMTQAEMENPENSPRWIQYKAEQIIYFRVAGNSAAVDEIRLLEVKSVQKDEWTWEDVTNLRRLIMIDGVYHNQLWNDKKELLSDVTPIADGSTWKEIPFVFFGADKNSPQYSTIPLYTLARTNLKHFVQDCDNADNLHFHGQGMTNVFTDMTPEEFAESNPNGLDVGAKGRNLFDAGDKVELLQLEATGAIPAEMLRKEQRMVMQGANLVTPISSNQTLGAKEIETNATTSTLKRATFNVSDGVETLQDYTARFLGEAGESTYKLNTDFITDTMTPEMITKQMEMVQGGVLPKATLYETARKVGFTKADDETLKDEAEKDSAEIQGMTQQQAVAQAANEAE